MVSSDVQWHHRSSDFHREARGSAVAVALESMGATGTIRIWGLSGFCYFEKLAVKKMADLGQPTINLKQPVKTRGKHLKGSLCPSAVEQTMTKI